MQNAELLQNEIRAHCIGIERYRGYRSTWCGDGAVIFVGPKGDEVKGHSDSRVDWLAPAWSVAKAEIDKRIAALGE